MKHHRPTDTAQPSRRIFAALLLGLSLFSSGCARHYIITTTNGVTISCKGRPKLSGGYYSYQDSEGQEQRINELRVREIDAK